MADKGRKSYREQCNKTRGPPVFATDVENNVHQPPNQTQVGKCHNSTDEFVSPKCLHSSLHVCFKFFFSPTFNFSLYVLWNTVFSSKPATKNLALILLKSDESTPTFSRIRHLRISSQITMCGVQITMKARHLQGGDEIDHC